MKINKLIILLISTLFLFSCSEEDESIMGTEGETPISVKASFSYTVSTADPYVAVLQSTTESSVEYQSFWDYGLGGGIVSDNAGIAEVRYNDAGEYVVKYYVIYDGLTTIATQTIRVDENGVCPDGLCGSTSNISLKDAATTFSVGTITRASWVKAGGKHTEILKKEFNNITSEYEMKMNVMYPSQGNYDFSAADAMVDFAQANGMNVHGHALIWHNATPSWVENFAGTNAEFEAMVKDYITTTLTRFKGKVRSWDVVNEAFEDGSGHPLRNSVFRQKMGDDYIKKCFQFARDADPDVLLFYNDYNMASSTTKRAAMFKMVDELGDLIDGVGAQMHISYEGPSKSNIEAVADGTVSRGLKLHFAELDIRANPNKDITTLTDDRAQEQRAKYKEVVQIYNSIPLANKFALTIWGVRDNESWLIDFWGNADWPLLFDSNYNKKAAYFGFLEGLQ
ncbi:endo-1,4-beta-xylanase [Polaribacter undariae]|uniref:Beta-xylanase n=1 Tax=Polaribacter sejongensis TaxID=985043 RepID=A0AAJ1VHP4_9FLAO|nr:endo-1,4-beta-xylanase [Polaribacter undariae]MDN3620534.1 endo-1,4-beta-xylanase [Polaribacter undariae]UWD31262.1 endo-1,4-beta-xylanase [Polaribacter undariae]